MFTWKILEVFSDGEKAIKVRYLLKADDETNIVETEGEHSFESQKIEKPFAELNEQDLITWVNQETTKNEVNPIKLNLQDQLDRLKNSQKVQFPWEVGTFTIE